MKAVILTLWFALLCLDSQLKAKPLALVGKAFAEANLQLLREAPVK